RWGWPEVSVAQNDTVLRSLVIETRDRLKQQTTEIADQRHAWHPDEALDRSGELTACEFTIESSYRSDKRWHDWGDPRAKILQGPTERAYLLPSRAAPEGLRNPRALRDEGALPRKKEITEAFVGKLATKPLSGFWFYRKMSDGMLRVHVYAAEYDRFLI